MDCDHCEGLEFVNKFQTYEDAFNYKEDIRLICVTAWKNRERYVKHWVDKKTDLELKNIDKQFICYGRKQLPIELMRYNNIEKLNNFPDYNPPRLVENPYDWYILEVPDEEKQ